MIPPIPRLYAAISVGALILALVIGLLLTRARLDTEKQGRALDRQAVATAQAEARAADLQHARDIEAAQTKVREEVSRDLETKLASARAAADDYARRLRNSAAQGGGNRAGLPEAADAPGAPAGAGEASLVDDLRTCSDNTVKAESWRDWWLGVSTIEGNR
jgi:hypothetical protein